MDPLSHAVVGMTHAGLYARSKSNLRLALVCAAAGALAPDLDVIIKSAEYPLLGVRYHRFFTHAIFFVPFGALLVAGFLWLFLKSKMAFKQIYLFAFLGMFTHGILDSLTNYGTHLFWPLTMRRESWSMISIVDPIFTLTLLFSIIVAAIRKSRKPLVFAACFAIVYWCFGYTQRERATAAMGALAAKRGHVVERFEVKPSIGNLFAWRVQYLTQNNIYIDAVSVSPLRAPLHYEGGVLPLYQPPVNLSATQAKDVADFTFFSDGWVSVNPQNPNEIGDVRFSMLPNGLVPLWVISLHPEQPEKHVDFTMTRQRKAGDIAELWRMIRGD